MFLDDNSSAYDWNSIASEMQGGDFNRGDGYTSFEVTSSTWRFQVIDAAAEAVSSFQSFNNIGFSRILCNKML